MIMQKDLLAGDLLLFKVKASSSLTDKFIGWGQKVMGMAPTKAEYCHVALVAFDPEFVMEAKWPKTRISKIDWKEYHAKYDVQLFRVKNVTTRQRLDAIHWAEDHLNEWYDLPSFLFGWIQFKHAVVCSTYVTKAERAAKIYFKTEKNGFIVPDQVAAQSLIWRVK
jgi:Permuted papain-like amidase enzyme, YaeF/YiiX, C92 family